MARQQGEAPHESQGSVHEPGPVDGASADLPAIDITPDPAAREPLDDGGGWLDGALRYEETVHEVAPAGAQPGTDAPAPARRPSRARRIVLASLLLVGLAGAATLGVTGMRILQQKDATLRPPASVAGLSRDNSASAAETAESLRAALTAGIDLDETTAAVYTDGAGRDRDVFLLGGTSLLFSPERTLDDALDLVRGQGTETSGMHEVDAGDLGGVMKCGTLTMPEGRMAACGWADHGSVAVAMFLRRDVEEAAVLTRQLRDATQTRS